MLRNENILVLHVYSGGHPQDNKKLESIGPHIPFNGCRYAYEQMPLDITVSCEPAEEQGNEYEICNALVNKINSTQLECFHCGK